MIRVYYNRRGPLPWSFDFGTQDTEVNVASIRLEGVTATSNADPENRDPDKPSAWLEIAGEPKAAIDAKHQAVIHPAVIQP